MTSSQGVRSSFLMRDGDSQLWIKVVSILIDNHLLSIILGNRRCKIYQIVAHQKLCRTVYRKYFFLKSIY
jgi:hypothetical protein